MKLLACCACRDICAIKQTLTRCTCRASSAKYAKDGLHVTFSGPCHILGMDNRDLRREVWFVKESRLPDKPYTQNAPWWIINPAWEDSHITRKLLPGEAPHD